MIVKARVTSSLLEELANGKFISAAFGVTLIFSFLIVPRSYKNPFLYFSVLFFSILRRGMVYFGNSVAFNITLMYI